jgi:hypothetical protein
LFLVDKELLLLDQLFLLLEVNSFASQMEGQLDLDLPMQLAYKLEVLFLALAQEFVQHYHKLELKCAVQTEDQLDLDLPTQLAYKLEALLLFLVDKELVLLDQLLETKECAIQTEDQLDLDLPMLPAFNNEVSLLFLALLADKELVLPDQLYLYDQPFQQLEDKQCAIQTGEQLDLDLPMQLAYNKEESLLFLALLADKELALPDQLFP